jgi:excinuclease ABC subunit C
MADPTTYRPRPGEIPTGPGVYRFRDAHGRVIYVGKAKSLRARLSSYFQDLSALHPRTQQMVTTATGVEWTTVATEVEALALEYSWIKEFDPRYNVKYRDDKSYPYLAVTMWEAVPRIQVMRGAKRPGTRYFGPYTHAWAIRETVDLLLRVFPVRTCSAGVFRRAQQTGRPCLLGYIDKCAAPCVGRISYEDHRALAEDFCRFMAGETAPFVRRIEKEMKEAAAELDYERAARLRDDLGALQRVVEKNAVVLPDGTDADIFAMASDELEASVQVFHVRGGRVRGQRGWVVEKVEELSDAELVEGLLQQVYGDVAAREEADVARGVGRRVTGGAWAGAGGARTPRGSVARGEVSAVARDGAEVGSIPREILVPVLPSDLEEVTAWLSGLRGSKVEIRVPQRGDKRALAETVLRNAEHALALHKTRRSGDLTSRSQALRELQEVLELAEAPLRIECYDVSTLQGTHQVASMVVFEDGSARRSEYRQFVVRGPDGEGARDDTGALAEVLRRRFRRQRAELDLAPAQVHESAQGVEEGDRLADIPAAESGEPRGRLKPRFAYPPNLVVVDGGPPQVAAVQRVLDELGITDVALVGLAKRLEEVWLPGEEFPLVLPRTSEGLYLLQRVRDEAHRVAISHHRKRRTKSMTASALDEVPGLGPARRAALLQRFGSVRGIRKATVEEIASVPGFGPRTAQAVADALGSEPNGAADRPTPDAGGLRVRSSARA